jgi:hypothetical protein
MMWIRRGVRSALSFEVRVSTGCGTGGEGRYTLGELSSS